MDELKGLAFSQILDKPFEEAVQKTVDALKTEGFGVLTEIDIQAALKKKLDKDFRKYRILGACNPPFAYRALQTSLDVGLMLPCNVIIYETDDGRIKVSAINPVSALAVIGNEDMKSVAEEVSARLKKAVDRLE